MLILLGLSVGWAAAFLCARSMQNSGRPGRRIPCGRTKSGVAR